LNVRVPEEKFGLVKDALGSGPGERLTLDWVIGVVLLQHFASMERELSPCLVGVVLASQRAVGNGGVLEILLVKVAQDSVDNGVGGVEHLDQRISSEEDELEGICVQEDGVLEDWVNQVCLQVSRNVKNQLKALVLIQSQRHGSYLVFPPKK
jgi:hypothetical protein